MMTPLKCQSKQGKDHKAPTLHKDVQAPEESWKGRGALQAPKNVMKTYIKLTLYRIKSLYLGIKIPIYTHKIIEKEAINLKEILESSRTLFGGREVMDKDTIYAVISKIK